MAFRGMYDVPGHGMVNVFDYENEVPTSLVGKKVGIVEATASNDLKFKGRAVAMSPNPGPFALCVALAIVILVVIGACYIVHMLTTTTVTKTDYGWYVQYPGGAAFLDEYGNLISDHGTPILPGIQNLITPIIIGGLILGGLYVTVAYILPAFKKRDYTAYSQPPTTYAVAQSQ